ncbi:MAG: flagellin FliC [Deltaproteobacteria bacterium]|nr:flagellin FliC [Deltaproteobacteria bacterium]MBN2673943.1 flagellin FliC [Deltaproteobacteria bacterium]
MAININTNLPAINAQGTLSKTNSLLANNLSKLASGKRLNTAKDGAAELAISEKLMAQLRALNQAQRNTMDGVSMIQTAEGATSEMTGNMARMQELAVQAANGTLSDSDRSAIMEEFNALRSEIDRTAATTEFNGQKLLDGSADVTLQIGARSGEDQTTNIQIGALTSSNLGDGNAVIADLDVSTQQGARDALTVMQGAMDQVSTVRAELGAKQNTLTSTMTNLAVERENIAAANSRIADVDVAQEAAELAQNQILSQAGTSVLAQANQLPAMAVALIG